MDRRDWLAALGMAGTTGFALLAGCGTKAGGDGGNDAGQSESGRTNNGTGGRTATNGTGRRTATNGTDAGENGTSDDAGTRSGSAETDVTTESAQTLDTGQAPPSDTGTPFENTNTVPERGGLETGRAPNATDE